jgi:hypothetical protein
MSLLGIFDTFCRFHEGELSIFNPLRCCCCCCSCRWDEAMSLNCGHQRVYCSSRKWYMSTESHGAIILTGENRITRIQTFPVPLSPPQIPHGVTRGVNSGLRGKRLAINRLSYGTDVTPLSWRETPKMDGKCSVHPYSFFSFFLSLGPHILLSASFSGMPYVLQLMWQTKIRANAKQQITYFVNIFLQTEDGKTR